MKWHAVIIEDGKLVKSKAVFEYCHKCGMQVVGKAVDTYPYCTLCFWKIRQWKKEIKSLILGGKRHGIGPGWYGEWKGLEDGYEYKRQITLTHLLAAVMNMGSLNKTPKVPQMMDDAKHYMIHELGIPQIWVEKFA